MAVLFRPSHDAELTIGVARVRNNSMELKRHRVVIDVEPSDDWIGQAVERCLVSSLHQIVDGKLQRRVESDRRQSIKAMLHTVDCCVRDARDGRRRVHHVRNLAAIILAARCIQVMDRPPVADRYSVRIAFPANTRICWSGGELEPGVGVPISVGLISRFPTDLAAGGLGLAAGGLGPSLMAIGQVRLGWV